MRGVEERFYILIYQETAEKGTGSLYSGFRLRYSEELVALAHVHGGKLGSAFGVDTFQPPLEYKSLGHGVAAIDRRRLALVCLF